MYMQLHAHAHASSRLSEYCRPGLIGWYQDRFDRMRLHLGVLETCDARTCTCYLPLASYCV